MFERSNVCDATPLHGEDGNIAAGYLPWQSIDGTLTYNDTNFYIYNGDRYIENNFILNGIYKSPSAV